MPWMFIRFDQFSLKCTAILLLSAPFLMAGDRCEKVFQLRKIPCVMITNWDYRERMATSRKSEVIATTLPGTWK
jgi:hypothetical protein